MTNETKGYTVAIANLPVFPNKEIKQFIDYVSGMKGFVGIHPHYPNGTLLIFDSKSHAREARAMIEAYGVRTGNNISEVFY